ncbi:hypothetical protein [Porphyromonas canoris]|uniref:hypothetical protein n=1 Tax=Porphyromonas canoris TaxID=36875 RepID=UPI00068ADB5B|nr:hypothetical protein [Porphyromonas canoris]
MLPIAIGAGMSVLGSVLGGVLQANEMRKAQQDLESRKQANKDLFDRRYNEDATQRASALRMINMASDAIRNRSNRSAGAQAVTGATNEAIALEKETANKAMTDVVSDIVAQNDYRKGALERAFLNRDEAFNAQVAQMKLQRAQGVADAVRGVMSAGASFAANPLLSKGGKQ